VARTIGESLLANQNWHKSENFNRIIAESSLDWRKGCHPKQGDVITQPMREDPRTAAVFSGGADDRDV
jgi:hypothetical protein